MKYLTKAIKLEALRAVQKVIEKQVEEMKTKEYVWRNGMCGPLEGYSIKYGKETSDKLIKWFTSQRPSKKQHYRFYSMFLENRLYPNDIHMNPYWFGLSLLQQENRLEFIEYLINKQI